MPSDQNKSNHSAAGQYLGYGLQTVRFCHHLLKATDEASISIELIDDIGYHGDDGSTVYEQNKSALKGNPISNWAEDLWKTISIWLDGIEAGKIDITCSKFRLYVSPSKKGKFASLLSNAVSPDQVEHVIQQIKTDLDKKAKPPVMQPMVERLLAATTDVRFALVSNLTIESDDDDPTQSIKDQLQFSVFPEQLDEVSGAVVGLAKDRSDRLLREGKPAILNAGEFKNAVRNFVSRYNLPGYLKSLAEQPSSSEIGALHMTRPTFVRQLELIEIDGDEQLRAVSDYLRASADRTDWADRGLISTDDSRDWDDALLRQHSMAFGEIQDVHSEKSPEVRGRLVYRRCNSWKGQLAGQLVPEHFVHGSLNELADCMMLGWHPNFDSELSQEAAA